MKCPGCELDIVDERKQVAHMELCHPEIILRRWKEAGLSADEIFNLQKEMEHKLPTVELLMNTLGNGLKLSVLVMFPKLGEYEVSLWHKDEQIIRVKGSSLRSTLGLAIETIVAQIGVVSTSELMDAAREITNG